MVTGFVTRDKKYIDVTILAFTVNWLLVNQNNDGDKFDKNALETLDSAVMLLLWS